MDHLQTALDRARRRRGFPSPAARRLLRLRAGLTQADIAKVLGTTTGAISRYESGDREPRPAILDRYLAVLERLSGETTPT
jgi:transcriptional regulator with XRE-family HTH domain